MDKGERVAQLLGRFQVGPLVSASPADCLLDLLAMGVTAVYYGVGDGEPGLSVDNWSTSLRRKLRLGKCNLGLLFISSL